ncbi:MAG: response regulator [Rhodanobacteraceae bacterium]
MPQILLAADDPISRAFLLEALRGFGVAVTAVVDGNATLDAARHERFDLLILDHRLPGLDGDRVLATLRTDGNALSRETIAIATTADPDSQIHQMLRDTGFSRVLVKPFETPVLRETLRELGIGFASSSLDGVAGVAASRSVEALRALRELFARELATLDGELDSLRRDPAALGERLHRLRAACGFCGAVALGEAAAILTNASQSGDAALVADTLDRFHQNLVVARAVLQKESGRPA